jgi:putative membrane protein
VTEPVSDKPPVPEETAIGTVKPGGPRRTSARLRTQFANERTFLAWVRTGLALVAFGFVVEKASPFLEQLAPTVAASQTNFIHLSGVAGVALMMAGSAIIVLSTVRFWHTGRQIKLERYRTSYRLDIAMAILMAIITIGLIFFTIYQSQVFGS